MAEKTQEETIQALNAKAKESGDSFFVRVLRKFNSTTALPETVALLDRAQIEHLVSPERWLPQLAGGGPVFVFQVYHSNDRSTLLGHLHFSVPTTQLAPKASGEIDPKIARKAGWAGPGELVYPALDNKQSAEPAFSIPTSLPPASSSGNSAAIANNVPGGGFPGAGSFRDPVLERNTAVLEQIQQETAKLQRAREEFSEQQRREREALAEERRRVELESVKRDSEQRFKELKAEMLAAAGASTPKSDITHTLTAVASAIAPILIKLFETQNEMRLAMLKQQESVATATAESNRTLMAAMLQKPSIDPVMERMFSEMKSLMEKSAAGQMPQSTMLHSMSEAMQSMTSMTMDLVQTAADLNLGGSRPEDHPALKAIREAIKAAQSMFAGYRAAALPVDPARQHLPPGAVPYAPPRAAPVHGLPTPQYQQQVHQPTEQQENRINRINAPPAQALPELPPARDVVEHLENMFKAQAPVDQVVELFLHAFETRDPALTRALDEAGGEIERMFGNRLEAFVLANPHYLPYMKQLLEELNRRGAAAGIFEQEDDGDDDEAPDEDDYSGDEDEQDAA